MARNYLLTGSYYYVIRGFIEADPNEPFPGNPIVPPPPRRAPAALDAWAGPWQGAQTHRTGWYPYYSLGLLTFDPTTEGGAGLNTGTSEVEESLLTGRSLAVSIGGNAVTRPSPGQLIGGSYVVDDDGHWGSGMTSSTDDNQTLHMLAFRFVLAEDRRSLEFVITDSAPRRTAASGTMVRYHRPLFAIRRLFPFN